MGVEIRDILPAIVMAAALYLWSRNVWVSFAGLSFALWALTLTNVILKTLHREARERESVLKRELNELCGAVVLRLDALSAMAQFVGEQSFPEFATAVKGFKSVQEEELRRKAQRNTEERSFEITLLS
jgi:hypothetical protein